VAKAERKTFQKIMDQINYRYWEETDNRAYQLYLGKRDE
jgi:threonine dehydratase